MGDSDSPNRDIRANETEWRLFAAFVGGCRLVAPAGTTRKGMLDRILRGVADAIDWAYVRAGKSTRGQMPMPSRETPESPVAEEESDHLHGTINGPSPGAHVRVMTLLWGWALDQTSLRGTGITAVRVYIDGNAKGTATYGIPRHDVSDQYGLQFKNCGWEFALDLQNVTPGPHTVQVATYSSVSGNESTYTLPLQVDAPRLPPVGRRFALFISGTGGDPMRYRCDHQAQQLELLGLTADVVLSTEVDLGDVVDKYEMFVLQRVPLAQDLDWFISEVRRRGKLLIYDTDDLIFDVDSTKYIAAFTQMSDRDREKFLDRLSRSRESLLRCDAVLVSTEPLRDVVRQLHPRVILSPNVVDRTMLQESAALLNKQSVRTGHSSEVTIAYLSGTPTHDRDFQQVAEDVIWALDTYPQTRLVTVGPLTLDSRFTRLAHRIEQLPLRPWSQLLELMREVDVNLAPLEPDNPFTNAKSCVKYLEAALVRVPTIASENPDFARVIAPGVTGFLAHGSDQWRAALARLIESRELRCQIGERARHDVVQRFTTAVVGPELLASLRQLTRGARDDEPLTINWLVRAPPGNSETVARLAAYLEQRGHRVRLLTVPRVGTPAVVPSVAVGEQPLPAADIDIATDATTERLIAARGNAPCRANFGGDAQSSFRTIYIEAPAQDDDASWAAAGAQLERALIETAIAPRVMLRPVSSPE